MGIGKKECIGRHRIPVDVRPLFKQNMGIVHYIRSWGLTAQVHTAFPLVPFFERLLTEILDLILIYNSKKQVKTGLKKAHK